MIVSQLQIYNLRRFKSMDGKPGLSITLHEGLNALIGENDSGKTAIMIMPTAGATASSGVCDATIPPPATPTIIAADRPTWIFTA